MNINGLRNRSLRSKLKTNASMSNQRSRKKALIKSPNLFLNLIKLVLVAILLVYISALLAIKYSSTVRRWFLFMNYVNYQACCYNLSRPELDYGLSCTRVFRVNSTDSIQLGVWHILPYSRNSECFDGVGSQFKSHVNAFNDTRPVILYLHGNGGTRGGNHRLSLYKRLSHDNDFNVVTFDYRGYGDSTNISPTSSGVTEDALNMYFWLNKFVNHSRINVWGHSLGSAISIRMISKLSSSQLPHSLILEGAFNNVYDVSVSYKLTKVYYIIPYFLDIIGKAFESDTDTNFNSDELITNLDLPTLILHAKDDFIIPYNLTVKLYESSLMNVTNKKHVPKLILYDTSFGYGHKNIWRDANLTDTINHFINP